MKRPEARLISFENLYDIVQNKRDNPRQGSKTSEFLAQPVARNAQKVGEEGVEVAIAASLGERERLVEETADMLYRTTIVLVQAGIPIREVFEELGRRHNPPIISSVPPNE